MKKKKKKVTDIGQRGKKLLSKGLKRDRQQRRRRRHVFDCALSLRKLFRLRNWSTIAWQMVEKYVGKTTNEKNSDCDNKNEEQSATERIEFVIEGN